MGGNRVVKEMTHVSGLSNQGGAGAVCVRFGARGGWLELGQGAIWRRGIYVRAASWITSMMSHYVPGNHLQIVVYFKIDSI